MRKVQLMIIALCSALPLSGCARREEQFEVETKAVRGILSLLEMYTHEHPGVRVTNLDQVFTAAGQGYPYIWHQRFHTFGKHAGFSNSFYEKYTFFPSGVTNRVIEGEVLLMNAKPYPGPEKRLLRNVVSTGRNGYFRQTLREEQIQHVFTELGILEPKPSTMPMPPPEPPSADEAFGQQAAELLGPPPFWRRRAWQAAGLVLIVAMMAGAGWWLGRRRLK